MINIINLRVVYKIAVQHVKACRRKVRKRGYLQHCASVT